LPASTIPAAHQRKRNIRCVLTTPTTCSRPQNDAGTALSNAQRTLRELSETGQRYTVTDLAARAGVSRAWLYAQTALGDQIRQLTDQRPSAWS
jgi:hypothetical protein